MIGDSRFVGLNTDSKRYGSIQQKWTGIAERFWVLLRKGLTISPMLPQVAESIYFPNQISCCPNCSKTQLSVWNISLKARVRGSSSAPLAQFRLVIHALRGRMYNVMLRRVWLQPRDLSPFSRCWAYWLSLFAAYSSISTRTSRARRGGRRRRKRRSHKHGYLHLTESTCTLRKVWSHCATPSESHPRGEQHFQKFSRPQK